MQLKSYEATAIVNELGIQVFSVIKLAQTERCKIHDHKMIGYDVGNERRLIFYCDKCNAYFVDQAKLNILYKFRQHGKNKFINSGSYELLQKVEAKATELVHYSQILRESNNELQYDSDYFGNEALTEAIKNNNVERVAILVNPKNLSTERDIEVGRTLFYAIECNAVEVTQYLLQLLSNQKRFGTIISSALFFAVRRQLGGPSLDLINSLLRAGADPNIADSCGRTPLHLLVRYASLEAVSVLLENGADVEHRDIMGNNALIYAMHNEEKIIRLLKAGADINTRYSDGKTLLTRASMYQDYEAVNILLKKGIDPNAKDEAGFTPMHYAAIKNNKEIIDLLVRYGVNRDG